MWRMANQFVIWSDGIDTETSTTVCLLFVQVAGQYSQLCWAGIPLESSRQRHMTYLSRFWAVLRISEVLVSGLAASGGQTTIQLGRGF